MPLVRLSCLTGSYRARLLMQQMGKTARLESTRLGQRIAAAVQEKALSAPRSTLSPDAPSHPRQGHHSLNPSPVPDDRRAQHERPTGTLRYSLHDSETQHTVFIRDCSALERDLSLVTVSTGIAGPSLVTRSRPSAPRIPKTSGSISDSTGSDGRPKSSRRVGPARSKSATISRRNGRRSAACRSFVCLQHGPVATSPRAWLAV
jgi:hypothetical protein